MENFDDHILEINGRAHRSTEIRRAYDFARELGFPQINIDLIAGMVEETEENWRDCVRQTIELAPDSVTIYQMEVPYNTTIYQEMKAAGQAGGAGGGLADQAPLGGLRLRRAGAGRLHGRQRLHRGEEIPPARASSIATASGRARTCSGWASPRSRTSAARISRTSTISSRMWPGCARGGCPSSGR